MGEPSDLWERSLLVEGLLGSPALVGRLQQLLDRLDALPPALRGLIRDAVERRLDGDLLDFLADYLDEHGLADGHKVRLLRPQAGDVLVVWDGWANPLAVREAADPLSMFAAVVVLPPGQDLATADPEQLRDAGWVRAEEAARRSDDRVLREAMRIRHEVSAEVRRDCARLAEQAADEYYARQGKLSSAAGFAADEIAGAIRSRLGG